MSNTHPTANPHQVTGANGINLSVTDLGPPDAPAIVLIHGWSQAALAWTRQHRLADDFRLVIPDLRGHGRSDKPKGQAAYDSASFGGDLAAVIAERGLTRPVLVGWSMGGWVLADYLRLAGDKNIAGFVLVGSSVTTGTHMPFDAQAQRGNDPAVAAAGMMGHNYADELSATVAFLRACFHRQPDPDDLAVMTGFNMATSYDARQSRRRSEDYRPVYARTTSPALVIRGRHERLSMPAMHDETMASLPRAQALTYDHSGHAPFWEEPDRFNSDLASFVRACHDHTPDRHRP
ncbi:MAG: alpha/beta hydrolase [Pseudomonadota bacterium]